MLMSIKNLHFLHFLHQRWHYRKFNKSIKKQYQALILRVSGLDTPSIKAGYKNEDNTLVQEMQEMQEILESCRVVFHQKSPLPWWGRGLLWSVY
jgi:hypothetical protein